jgi:hypothetical protein
MLWMYDVAVICPHFKNLETLYIYEATNECNQTTDKHAVGSNEIFASSHDAQLHRRPLDAVYFPPAFPRKRKRKMAQY